MHKFNPFRPRKHVLSERREIYGEAPEPPELGGIEINMNPRDKELYPNKEKASKRNEQTVTFEQFVRQLERWFEETYQRVVGKKARSMERVRANAQARGRDYIPSAPGEFKSSLREQMVDFDERIQTLAKDVFRLEDFQRGVQEMTKIYPKAWNGFWDIVQNHPGFEGDHPLFKTDRWRTQMRVPGAYVDGHLAALSMHGMDRYKRNRSGALDELKKPVTAADRIENHVDLKYRQRATNLMAKEFSITNNKDFDRIRWYQNQEMKGNEEYGFAQFIEVSKMPKYDRGKTVPGSGGRGLVMIDGDFDDPEKAPMIFINYGYLDQITGYGNNHPYFEHIFTTEGFLNENQLDDIGTLLADERNTYVRGAEEEGLSERTWKFYARDSVALYMKKFKVAEPVVRKMMTEGIRPEHFEQLKTDPAHASVRVQMKGVVDAFAGNEDVLKDVLKSFCQDYIRDEGPNWFENLIAILLERENDFLNRN